MQKQLWQVITVLDSREAAEALGRDSVRENLAACAQLEGPVSSIYIWKGELHEDQETRLTLKTTGTRVEKLMEWLKAHHPYEVPEILAYRVDLVDPDYLDWANKA